MKKQLIVIGTAVLLLVVGLSGCIQQITNKNNSIPPSIKSLIYDDSKLEVSNLIVETWGYNNSKKEIIGNGFLTLPDYYEYGVYHINGTMKNIADYELENVDVRMSFYDTNGKSVGGGTTHYRKDGVMGSICDGCIISLERNQHSNTTYWEKYHHMELIITIVE